MESIVKRNDVNELIAKQKQTYRLREQVYGYQGGRVWGRIDWEFGIDMYTLLYLK